MVRRILYWAVRGNEEDFFTTGCPYDANLNCLSSGIYELRVFYVLNNYDVQGLGANEENAYYLEVFVDTEEFQLFKDPVFSFSDNERQLQVDYEFNLRIDEAGVSLTPKVTIVDR